MIRSGLAFDDMKGRRWKGLAYGSLEQATSSMIAAKGTAKRRRYLLGERIEREAVK